jgi:hypothetical protein
VWVSEADIPPFADENSVLPSVGNGFSCLGGAILL